MVEFVQLWSINQKEWIRAGILWIRLHRSSKLSDFPRRTIIWQGRVTAGMRWESARPFNWFPRSFRPKLAREWGVSALTLHKFAWSVFHYTCKIILDPAISLCKDVAEIVSLVFTYPHPPPPTPLKSKMVHPWARVILFKSSHAYNEVTICKGIKCTGEYSTLILI